MFEKLPEVLKAVGTYVAGIAFVAGVVFCFLGFFDVGDFKSVKTRVPAAWPPVIAGSFLIAIGLGLHLLRPQERKALEDSEQKQSTFATERSGWDKASDYAVRALTLRGLAENEGSEYRISVAGRKYLHSAKTRDKYMNAFSKSLAQFS